MRNDPFRDMTGMLVRTRRRHAWHKVVSVLACIVVFCTTYALILPAITLEKKPVCGKTEHTHTESCYTQVTVVSRKALICTAALHQHTEGCYDETGNPICGFADFVVHRHSTDCYDESGTLCCPLPEIGLHTHDANCCLPTIVHTHTDACYALEQGDLICTKSIESPHTHTEACYAETGDLICGISQSDAHQHTDDCYTWNQVLICDLPTDPAAETQTCGKEEICLHTHCPDCFDEAGNRICGQVQVLEHVHSEDCFQTVEEPVDTEALTCKQEESKGHQHGALCYGRWELTCGLEEHTHGLMCSADPNADVETKEIWEQTIPETTSGIWRDDVLAIAASQLGYRESEHNFILDDAGQPIGRTRYGEWFGAPYGKWDAMFVSFCLSYANVKDFPLDGSCTHWMQTLQNPESSYFHAKGSYGPRAGDLIFFDLDEEQGADHVGLIAEMLAATQTEPVRIRVIEGGLEHSVRSVTYALEDSRILGYGELPEQDMAVYQWCQDGIEVTVSFPQSNMALPENTQLVVERLPSDDAKNIYVEAFPYASEESRPAVHFVDLMKVSLTADGQEIVPPGKANVTIRLLGEQYPIMTYTEILHCTDDDTELIPSDLDDGGNLAGSSDSNLSAVYAVVGASDVVVGEAPARAPNAPSGTTVTPHKTIDAFRDGVDNPDTDLDNRNVDKTDLYRLYLDAQLGLVQSPVDLLIVVDQSGSMRERDMLDKDNRTPIDRGEAVRLVLNGTYSSRDYASQKQNGLIYQFLAMHPENQVAVVGFQGSTYGAWDYTEDAAPIVEWTTTAKYVNVDGRFANGTDYCAGLLEAGKMLDKNANNGHKKVLLFLSDGVPTYYLAKDTYGRYRRYGTGNSMDETTKNASKQFYLDLLAKYPQLTTFTIGISRDITGTDASGSHSSEILEFMATQGGGTYSGVESTADLTAALMNFVYDSGYTNFVIQDTLSRYVSLYERQPDFKLTMRHQDGTQTVLYDNGAVTPSGSNILSGITYDSNTGQVTASFLPTYHLEAGGTYTLSFNVMTSQTAYDHYAKHGYPDTGDGETDYAGNTTSSMQPGFRANTTATLEYASGSDKTTLTYPHPVVQAGVCQLAVQKTDNENPNKKLPGAEFALYLKATGEEAGETLTGLDGLYVKIQQGLTTDVAGQCIVDNLVPGDYYLVETKAPDGYMKRAEPILISLARGTDGSGQIAGSSETVTIGEKRLPLVIVPNEAWGFELPNTGGPGNATYTSGGLLIICSVLLLLYLKKKHGKEDFASS